MALSSYLKSCVRNTPGNQYQAYMCSVVSITSITNTSGEVSAVTMNSTAKFQRVQGKLDNVQFTSEANLGNTSNITHTLKMGFDKLTSALNNWLFGASGVIDEIVCGMVVIHVDGNGQAWISGISPALVEGALRPYQSATVNFDSGMAPTDDAAKPELTLTRTGAAPAYPFDSTINAAIVGGTASFINWSS